MSPPDSLLAQGVAFAVAALTGVALGLMLDGYRALRRALRPARLLGHFLDVALVAGAVPVLAGGMLAANWGELRVYPVLALALGGALYLALASPVLLPVAVWGIRVVVRAVVAVVRAVTAPFRAAVTAGGHFANWIRSRSPRPAEGPPESDAGGERGTAAPPANPHRPKSERGERGGAQNVERLGRGPGRRGIGGRFSGGRMGGRRRDAATHTPGRRGRRF